MVAFARGQSRGGRLQRQPRQRRENRDRQTVGNRDDQRLVDLLGVDGADGGQRPYGLAAERTFARVVVELHHLVPHARVDQHRQRRSRRACDHDHCPS